MEIRQNRAVQCDWGTRKGASEGYACTLEEEAKRFPVRLVYLEGMHLLVPGQRLRLPCTCQHSPRSWPMADWFMEECMMLSDWTLGGRGGIWLPATHNVGERIRVQTFVVGGKRPFCFQLMSFSHLVQQQGTAGRCARG